LENLKEREVGRLRHRWGNNIRTDVWEIRWKFWTGFIWLRIGSIGGPSDHGSELSGSINGGEFLT
jgi:hypothetical protein